MTIGELRSKRHAIVQRMRTVLDKTANKASAKEALAEFWALDAEQKNLLAKIALLETPASEFLPMLEMQAML